MTLLCPRLSAAAARLLFNHLTANEYSDLEEVTLHVDILCASMSMYG